MMIGHCCRARHRFVARVLKNLIQDYVQVAVCCGVLRCVAVCCSVLQCVTESDTRLRAGCSVLQCVAVCCSVLQCVAVCCSV